MILKKKKETPGYFLASFLYLGYIFWLPCTHLYILDLKLTLNQPV